MGTKKAPALSAIQQLKGVGISNGTQIKRCKHCNDFFEPANCPIFGIIPRECPACNAEIVHGRIILGCNTPVCGNVTEYKEEDEQYFSVIPGARMFF